MYNFNKGAAQFDLSRLEDFFFKKGTIAEYKKKEYFILQNYPSNFIGFIKSGIFRFTHLDDNGNEHIVGYRFQRELVCDYPSFIKCINSMTSIQAVIDSAVYLISKKELEDWLKTDVDAQRVVRQMSEGLHVEMHERLLSFYCHTPEQRYTTLLQRYPNILQLITLKEVASLIGVTPETISHIRRKLLLDRKS